MRLSVFVNIDILKEIARGWITNTKTAFRRKIIVFSVAFRLFFGLHLTNNAVQVVLTDNGVELIPHTQGPVLNNNALEYSLKIHLQQSW